MNEGVFGLMMGIVFGVPCLMAFFAVLAALFPRAVERTRKVIDDQPLRAFLVGLVNLIFLVALALGLGSLRDSLDWAFLAIVQLLVLTVLLVGVTFGLAGLVQVLGVRLAPSRGPIGRTMWGTGALALACLIPYVGWFGLLAYAMMLGMGGFILSWFGPRADASDRPQEPTAGPQETSG